MRPAGRTMRFYAQLAATAVIAAAALIVVGCGGTVIDDVKTADTIQRYLERSLDEDVRSVDCPASQPIDPKSTFNCDVTLAGGQEKIATVEIRNEDADFGIVDYKPKG